MRWCEEKRKKRSYSRRGHVAVIAIGAGGRWVGAFGDEQRLPAPPAVKEMRSRVFT